MTRLTETDRQILTRWPASTRVAMRHADAADARVMADSCRWTLDPHDCAWETDCGACWQFNDGGPADNGVVYCHKCGRRVLAETDAR